MTDLIYVACINNMVSYGEIINKRLHTVIRAHRAMHRWMPRGDDICWSTSY